MFWFMLYLSHDLFLWLIPVGKCCFLCIYIFIFFIGILLQLMSADEAVKNSLDETSTGSFTVPSRYLCFFFLRESCRLCQLMKLWGTHYMNIQRVLHCALSRNTSVFGVSVNFHHPPSPSYMVNMHILFHKLSIIIKTNLLNPHARNTL